MDAFLPLSPQEPVMARRNRYKDVQLPQLRSFCVVAGEGNFTAAAKSLGLSAPTVWEQVRALERRLGATLLRRRGRLVELTAEGRVLLELVQPHVTGLESLDRLFAAQCSAGLARLTVASTPNLLANHLVGPVQEFSRAYPSVCVTLRPNIRLDDGLSLLQRGQADLGVLAFRSEQMADPSFEYEPLFVLRLMLLTATGHPLTRKRKVTPADLVPYPLIMHLEGAPSRLAVDGLLARHHLRDQVRVVLESSHADVIRSYVASDIGIALIYTAPDGPPQAGIHRRLLDPSVEDLPVCLVHRKGAHLSEPVLAFGQIVRRSLQRRQRANQD
jgi:DNA-binding transcriptional LysR family regulator